MAWVLLCKPIRAPFRDGTSVLVRNMLRAMPTDVELVYFGDPSAPIRSVGDRVLAATGMRYQPSLSDKARLLGRLLTPSVSRLPIHSFFAANRSSSKALAVLQRVPRRRPTMQTLPASTGAEALAGLLDRLDRVIVTSDWGRGRLIEAGVAADRVARIYPGVAVPEEVSAPALAQRRGVLFAGDLDRSVGERLLAIAGALASRPDWRLDVATRAKGEAHAEVRAELERRLGSAIAAGRVRLLGEVQDMAALFDAAAIQLYLADHARKKVDLPFALLEGMARGVPVAIVDADPVRELLEVAGEREVGLRLEPARFAASVDALVAVLEQPERLAGMGAAARELVRARLSDVDMAAAYREHYAELA